MYVSPTHPHIAPFEATIQQYSDAPDECTIAPLDVPEDRLTTTWLTAKEGSFCSAVDMR